jgi:hypothetical protein
MKISGHAGTCNTQPAKADQLQEDKVEAEFTNENRVNLSYSWHKSK